MVTTLKSVYKNRTKRMLLLLLIISNGMERKRASVHAASNDFGQTLKFSQQPNDLTILNTIGGRIECRVQANPQAIVRWVDDSGATITDVKDLRYVLNGGTLDFHPFASTSLDAKVHNRKYRCLATNKLGTIISRIAKVNAVVDENVSPIVHHQTTIRNGIALFKCQVPMHMRTFIHVVSWTIKGASTQRNVLAGSLSERFRSVNNGDLVVSDVEMKDADLQFSCVTKNTLSNVTSVSSSGRLFVREPSGMFLRMLTDSASNQTVGFGQGALLVCLAVGNPAPEYTWYKEGAQLSYDQRIEKLANGYVSIKDARLEDQGTYECQIKSGEFHHSQKIHFEVTANLRVTRKPQGKEVSVGSTVEFACEAQGQPYPNIFWYKNGQRLTPNSRVSVIGGKVRIAKSQPTDEGIYQCIARNNYGETTTEARLVVDAVSPTIRAAPSSQIVGKLSSITLLCSSYGRPKPQISWHLDSKPITNDGKMYTMTETVDVRGMVTSKLGILNIRVSDSGSYLCIVQNRAGVAFREASIRVEGQPEIVGLATAYNALEGEPYWAHCQAKGYPKATVRWTKDSVPLKENQRIAIYENGTLMIKSVDKKVDEGNYVCRGTNIRGYAERSFDFTVSVPPTITPFTWQPIVTGYRAQFVCTVQTGELPIKITWYWNGNDITNGQGVSISSSAFSSSLIFTTVKREHRGRYTCLAQNRFKSASHSSVLVVNEKPSFKVEPKDSFVLEGRSVGLPCEASGFPQPQITWYKVKSNQNEALVQLDRRVTQLDNGTLYITSTGADDDSQYVCEAANGVGPAAKRTVSITINVPARLERSYHMTVLNELKGKAIQLSCSAFGTPNVVVTWEKSSQLISSGGNYKYQQTTTFNGIGKPTTVNSTLQLKVLRREDNGSYYCKAVNPYGVDSLEYKVAVLEKPDPVSSVAATSIGSRSIVLVWVVGYHGNLPISSYRLEHQMIGSTKWNTEIYQGNGTSYELKGLSPGHSYLIRISAGNAIGYSQSSPLATLKTAEEAPSSPPLNVTAAAITSQRILVEWKDPPIQERNGQLLGYYVAYYPTYKPIAEIRNDTLLSNNVHQYTLKSLQPFTSYTVTVQAFNGIGSGPPSAEQQVKTHEGVPRIAPQQIEATVSGSDKIIVKWRPPPESSLNGILQGYKVIYEEINSKQVFTKVILDNQFTTLSKLRKFSLYKVAVLAFTKAGDGVLSKYIQRRTGEDIPSPPERFQSVPSSPNEIMVTWQPPKEPNGNIVGYVLFYEDASEATDRNENEISLPTNQRSYLLKNLIVGRTYSLWMKAETAAGPSPPTRKINLMTMNNIPARILTSTLTVDAHLEGDVTLPCLAIGHPQPMVSWYFNQREILIKRRRWVAKDGKLRLKRVTREDAGTYNCTSVNQFGSDWNIVKLVIQVPPEPPRFDLVTIVRNVSINASWLVTSDGNSPITKFHLKSKSDGEEDWKTKTLSADIRWTMLDSPEEALYVKIAAENAIGIGLYSNTVKAVLSEDGLVTTVLSPDDSVMARTNPNQDGGESILGPAIAVVVIIVVIITLLVLIASWDRDLREFTGPKCYRLALFRWCHGRNQYLSECEGPYSEPTLPWPWNVPNRQILDGPQLSIPRLLNHSEHFAISTVGEFEFLHNLGNSPQTDGMVQPPPLREDPRRPSSKASRGSSSRSSFIYKSASEISEREPLTMDHNGTTISDSMVLPPLLADNGHVATTIDRTNSSLSNGSSLNGLASRGLFAINPSVTSSANSSNGGPVVFSPAKRKLVRKTADKAVDQRLEVMRQERDSNCRSTPQDLRVLSRNKALMIKEEMRRRGAQSYDSISSTCSSSRGELVRAYEFGKKYQLQNYAIPAFPALDSTLERPDEDDLASVCDFSSLPRNMNDCQIFMPIPVRSQLSNVNEAANDSNGYASHPMPTVSTLPHNGTTLNLSTSADHDESLV